MDPKIIGGAFSGRNSAKSERLPPMHAEEFDGRNRMQAALCDQRGGHHEARLIGMMPDL